MIHKAVKHMVTTKYGDDTWDSIIAITGFDASYFLPMNNYADDETIKLIYATADILKRDVPECLFDFGKSWIEQSVESYKGLFDIYGGNLPTMLENLNSMHDSITSSFPKYKPPSFIIEKNKEHKYNIIYKSERVGLETFVLGLIEGLAEYFKTKINIKQTSNTISEFGQISVFELNIIEPLS